MSATKEYDQGNVVRVVAVFRNAAAVLIDPTTVSCKVKDPSGAVTTFTHPDDPQVVMDSTGNYHVDISANAAGRWYYRFYSTGSGEAAAEGQFVVRGSNFS